MQSRPRAFSSFEREVAVDRCPRRRQAGGSRRLRDLDPVREVNAHRAFEIAASPAGIPSAEAGLDAVEAACAEVLSAKLCGRDVVLNILARQRDAAPPRPVATPAALTLAIEPAADCARYDQLRHPPLAEEAYRGAA